MANEIYGVPGAVVYAKVETTYNTDPTISSGDRVFVLEGEFAGYKPTMISRNGISAFRPAFKPVLGATEGPWSATVELDHKTVSSSAFPNCNVWLLLCCFARTHANNADYVGPGVAANGSDNDEILTYTLQSSPPIGSSSARIEYTEINESSAEGIKWVTAGARADFTLTLEAGEPVTLSLSGMGIASAPTKVSSPTTDDALPATQPMVAQGMSIALYEIDADTVYGAGTVASPTGTLAVQSCTITSALGTVGDKGMNATGAYKRFRQSPREPFTAEIFIEQTTWSDDWDIYTFLVEGTGIQFTANVVDPSTAGNYTEVDFTAVIMEISKSDDGSRRMATLTVAGLYAEDSADGGGLTPSDSLTLKWITQAA